MAVPDQEPEFDFATWTPDKPWPKGYYKPVPGLIAAIERQDRISGTDTGFRRFFWGLASVPFQVAGLFAAAANHFQHGLLHDAARAVTPAPLFLFFAVAMPMLLHEGIVQPPGTPLRRLTHGLVCSLALLAVLAFAIMARPLLRALLDWIIALLQP